MSCSFFIGTRIHLVGRGKRNPAIGSWELTPLSKFSGNFDISPFRGDELTIAESWWIDFLPSLKGYSPVRGDVVADDKGVPVSGRKGGFAVGKVGRVPTQLTSTHKPNHIKINRTNVLDKGENIG